MYLDAPLMGTELSAKNIADSVVQLSTSYVIDNAPITFPLVDGEIVRKMGDFLSEVVGADTWWCSANWDLVMAWNSPEDETPY